MKERRGWRSCKVRDGHGVGLWKTIRKEWDPLNDKISFLVGNGQRVIFWKDKWYGDKPFVFPSPPYML